MMQTTIFSLLLKPLEAILGSLSTNIDRESGSKKLFFKDFVEKLLFGFVYQSSSLRNLSLELQTNDLCKALFLKFTPFSTLKDGFSRFDSVHVKKMFESVLAQVTFLNVPHLDELGLFRVIDGSLFPTLIQMGWTSYRNKKNAFKLHLSFNLNQMIPSEFWIKDGNSCERSFLAHVVQSGMTYIADRGYFSFDLAHNIIDKKAFFIFRIKDNLLYQNLTKLPISPENMPDCFKNMTDSIISFTNDSKQNKYRLVTFSVWDSHFLILTNRFDLTTLNIITLYAFRWQIELFFKFFKRTIKGIHLLNHSENGVQIQFYLMMTLALLEINLKQTAIAMQSVSVFFTHEATKKIKQNYYQSPTIWIQNIAQPFYYAWKISKNWLIILKNSLVKQQNEQIFNLLARY